MCSVAVHITPKSKRLSLHQVNRYDPTRTLTLRNRFVSDLNKRFRELRGEIRRAIVDQDVFGLSGTNGSPTTNGIGLTANVQRRAFSFPRSQDKVSSFMEWLEGQVNTTILEVRQREQIGQAIDQAWTNVYIEDTYKRGVQRARYEMKRAGYDIPSVADSGGLQAVMDIPVHADRLGLLYTRTYNELRGVTDAMDQQISRVLAQGIADGDNPMLLARKLNATISGKGIGDLGLTDTLGRYIPAERRARMIARTEVIRAHHQASIQEYRNWQVEGVRVQAEWRTAGDERVCDECDALQGEVFTLQEIEGMIPVHPQCRCFALPVPAGDVAEQRTTQDIPDEELRIQEIENQIAGKEVEHAYLFDDDGRPLMNVAGEYDNVQFTEEQWNQFKGNILTHNHPDNRSFSPLDIDVLHNSGLKQIRVATPEYTYYAEALGRNPGYGNINMRYRITTTSLQDKYFDYIDAGTMSKATVRAELSHEVWLKLAEAANIKYWRVRR